MYKMGGGLMQLVAYGAQDIYLTGNPQITFFKVVYRRHTNFSMETIEQTVNGTSQLSTSTTTGTVTVSRNGDLLGPMYVKADLNTSAADGIVGDKLISEVRLEIGGQEIDKQNREWMQMWSELTVPEGKAAGYRYMTGGMTNTLNTNVETAQNAVHIPLQFYFCRNPGCYLPLIALQYHEVKVKFTWGVTTEIARDAGTIGTAPTCQVFADYVYLDTDERRRFAQVSHEYLIEQVQFESGSADSSHKLNFNHPVKALYWTTTAANNPTTQTTKLTLNGHDRLSAQTREYYQLRQPYQHHTAVPGANILEGNRVQMLQTPLVAGTYNLQALSGDDTTDLTTALGTDEDACMGVLGSLTADAAVTESGDGLTTLIIREATADQTFKVGDRLQVRINAVNEDTTDVSSVQTFSVVTVRVGSIGGKSYTELGLDRNPLSKAAQTGGALVLTDDDQLVIEIVARAQDAQPRVSSLTSKINMYSFALKPEEHQPSGTCNFSRIDTAKLQHSASVTVANIYALNYNVLRVMSGMGGLAYSN